MAECERPSRRIRVRSAYSDKSSTVRDFAGRTLRHCIDKFSTTRDAAGRLISNNVASPGFLIQRRTEAL